LKEHTEQSKKAICAIKYYNTSSPVADLDKAPFNATNMLQHAHDCDLLEKSNLSQKPSRRKQLLNGCSIRIYEYRHETIKLDL